jgi:hypothetical protein
MANPLVASLGLGSKTDPKMMRSMILAMLLQLLNSEDEPDADPKDVHDQPEVPVRPRVEPLGG